MLVTGGTGTLGRPTVDQLRRAGHDVRVLSRRPGTGHAIGDLETGEGLAEALKGIDVVLDLATTRKKDARQTQGIIDAVNAAGTPHLIYISIVGVDRIPFAYYVDKLACERLIETSGVPFTILRATQFHDFLGDFLLGMRRLPVLPVLDVPVQPIRVEEVADRLAELAAGPPQGRVADIGGPEISSFSEFASQWQRAFGTRKPMPMLRLPGKTIRAFKAGHHTTGLPGYGTGTFAEYAAGMAAR